MAARTMQAHSLTDGELIARSGTAGEAFHELFDRHFTAVHRYLARRVGRDRAEDLASQTFAVAFSRRATFRADATDARPWLLGIATNLLMNERRAEQRSPLPLTPPCVNYGGHVTHTPAGDVQTGAG